MQEGRDQTVVEVAASAAVAIAGDRWSVTSDRMIRRRKCYQLRLNSSGHLVVSFYFLVNFWLYPNRAYDWGADRKPELVSKNSRFRAQCIAMFDAAIVGRKLLLPTKQCELMLEKFDPKLRKVFQSSRFALR